jgi:hypothetical protein
MTGRIVVEEIIPLPPRELPENDPTRHDCPGLRGFGERRACSCAAPVAAAAGSAASNASARIGRGGLKTGTPSLQHPWLPSRAFGQISPTGGSRRTLPLPSPAR